MHSYYQIQLYKNIEKEGYILFCSQQLHIIMQNFQQNSQIMLIFIKGRHQIKFSIYSFSQRNPCQTYGSMKRFCTIENSQGTGQ